MGEIRGRLPSAYYNPKQLMDALQSDSGAINRKVIEKDYRELRKLAEGRLKRFVGTEWMDSRVYRYNVARYKPLSQIKDDKELASLLTDLHEFINAKTGTISGLERQRKETIETLHERGYDFVTKENFKAFVDFMDDMRHKKISSLYDSERIAEIFATAEKKKVDPEVVKKKMLEYTREHSKTPRQVQNLKKRSSEAVWKGLKIRDNYSAGTPGKSTRKNSNSKKT